MTPKFLIIEDCRITIESYVDYVNNYIEICHRFSSYYPLIQLKRKDRFSLVDSYTVDPLEELTKSFLSELSYLYREVLENPYKFLKDDTWKKLAIEFVKKEVDIIELKCAILKYGKGYLDHYHRIVITKRTL